MKRSVATVGSELYLDKNADESETYLLPLTIDDNVYYITYDHATELAQNLLRKGSRAATASAHRNGF